MTQQLYRKEALESRNRSLYGEIVLKSAPSMWVVTVLLVALCIVMAAGLFFIKVQSPDGPMSIYKWIMQSFSRG